MTENAPPIVVVKVGGSLLGWSELAEQLAADLHRRRPDARLVLIAGGGGAANWIRELDRRHRLGEERSHDLALRALDLTAHALHAFVPGSVVVARLTELDWAWSTGAICILAPRIPLDEDETRTDALPKSWRTTTDSIAARLAVRLDAKSLVLLKSAPLQGARTRDEAVELGLVDPLFAVVARALRCVLYRNLRDPGSVDSDLA
jgi:aspartokinase-like uncharacterized kinase